MVHHLRDLSLIAFAAVLLSSCSQGGPPPLTPGMFGQPTPVAARIRLPAATGFRPLPLGLAPSTLRGEKLRSTSVTLHCYHTYKIDYVTFSTSGSASGPISGTFSASGVWVLGKKDFEEKYAISSGSQQIAGKVSGFGTVTTCRHFSGRDLSYGDGYTSVDISKGKFKEEFR